MRTKLLIPLFLLLFSNAWSHDFYFSFAEMEYNAITRKIEITLTVTTHDLERSLEADGNKIDNIASLSDDEASLIESYINKHFQVSSLESSSKFRFIGHEVFLDGTSNFYFESEEIELTENVEITYDVLMETFSEQQNKLTFYYENRTLTAAFTQINKTQTLQLENNEE